MIIIQSIISYKVLLPIGIVVLILFFSQKLDNFIRIDGLVSEHIKIFKGSIVQLLFFFATPILFASSFVQLKLFDRESFNTLYVVVSILVSMFFSILTVLEGYRDRGDDKYKNVLKETKCSILFELILCIFITIYAFVFQLIFEVIGNVINLILSWFLYYLIIFLLLNLFIVIKRYKKLDSD